MRIIISSAGRRVYLVQWFKEALQAAGLDGDVIVLDHNQHAAAVAVADGYRYTPPFASDEYAPRVLKIVDELSPDLFISLNDHEITKLSEGLSSQLRARGVAVPMLDIKAQRAVADKFTMSTRLKAAGINTPVTHLLSDLTPVNQLIDVSDRIIVKDRWGSGSSGLRRFSRHEARAWLEDQYGNGSEMTRTQLDNIIVQPDVGGIEYGLDIITDVNGGSVQGVLARRKLGMRHGETSSAITVENTSFLDIADALNDVLGIRGSVDVDVLMDHHGTSHVIDINPRFGGGYPFSHVAGADVPSFYIASTLNQPPKNGWNQYRAGFVGAKHEGIVGFEPSTVGNAGPQGQPAPALRT